MDVRVVALPSAGANPLPKYETAGSAGADVRAAIPDSVTIAPGAWATIPLGFAIEVPAGFELQIRPRSSARRNGVTILNSPGTIDSDYRDEVGAILINHGPEPVVVNHGDRIAQMVIAPVVQARFVIVDELSPSDRKGGFGSTGAR